MVYMQKSFIQAAAQAAHEWYSCMTKHAQVVIEQLDGACPGTRTYCRLDLSQVEIDALAYACAKAILELTGRPIQTAADREYRCDLVAALGVLSRNVDVPR